MADDCQQRFARFIEPHLDGLRRVAYRLCRGGPDAEDLVQDVCLRALQKSAQLDEIDMPRTWLLRIQYNLFVDSVRRQAGSATESIEEHAPGATRSLQDHESPEAEAEAAEIAEQLSVAWPELNEDQQALLAYYAEGYTLNELVEITGLPLGTLKARLHRARVRLGKLLRAQRRRPRAAATSGE
jgi:RNA polymerase sigma-70 factor (ECF subfamily)